MNEKPVAAGKSSFDLIDSTRVLSKMHIPEGTIFLDIACGTGKYSIAVARKKGESVKIFAVDLWQAGLEELQRESARSNIDTIQPILADIRRRLPFADNSVDSCLMATILHDLSPGEREAVIGEAARLLKPGGILHIIEFKKVDYGPGPPVRIRLDIKDIASLVVPHGFGEIAGNDIGEYIYMVQYRKSHKVC